MNILNPTLMNDSKKVAEFPYVIIDEMCETSRAVYLQWLSHPETSEDKIASCYHAGMPLEEKAAVARNPNCPNHIINCLLNDARDFTQATQGNKIENSQSDILLSLARNPNVSSTILATIAAKKRPSTFLALARHPKTPHTALRLIGLLSKDALVLETLIMHPTVQAKGPFELLNTAHPYGLQLIAKHCVLTEKEIAELWQINGRVREALVMNAHLSAENLAYFASVDDVNVVASVAKNPSLPSALMKMLSHHREYVVKRSLATNPVVSVSLLSRLAKEKRGDVAGGVASNPNADADTLALLSTASATSVREAVAAHANASEKTLERLSRDAEDSVRERVSLNPNTPLSALKVLAGDTSPRVAQAVSKNTAMGVISELKGSDSFLRDIGPGAFLFYQQMSPKRATKTMINSKHPMEVEFIFGSKNAAACDALSSLQGAFTNHKGKLDRDGYLRFVEVINQRVPFANRAGCAVESDALQRVFKYFSMDLVVDIMVQFSPDEAKDTLRMLSAMVMHETERTNQEEREKVLGYIRRHGGMSLHDRLVKIMGTAWVRTMPPFYQRRYTHAVSEASKLLDSGWEVNLPTTAQALHTIGDQQNHCVGTQFYANRCVMGTSIIFQIMPQGDMRHGYTFEFLRNGRLAQAKGFANSSVPEHLLRKGKQVFNLITTLPDEADVKKAA